MVSIDVWIFSVGNLTLDFRIFQIEGLRSYVPTIDYMGVMKNKRRVVQVKHIIIISFYGTGKCLKKLLVLGTSNITSP